jgi:hypothetical protein
MPEELLWFVLQPVFEPRTNEYVRRDAQRWISACVMRHEMGAGGVMNEDGLTKWKRVARWCG